MKIYYKDGFYFGDGFVPEGAIEITESTYRELLDGQAAGKQIIANDLGAPILVEPQPSEWHTLENGHWIINDENQQHQVEKYREQLIRRVSDKTDRLKSQILVGYPQAEIDSFYRQEKEALAYQDNPKADIPMLRAIAAQREMPLDELVQKVLAKAALFAGVMGGIIGHRQHLEDKILFAKNSAELTACEEEIEQWQLPNH